MNSKIVFAILTTLGFTLIACSSPEAPKVSSVTVTGPASNALKINGAVAFTAAAKDSSGTAITGKTFTFTSSDENIASVDSSGKVTAKRFGKVTITASVDGVKGSSAAQTTYGLEAIGGTRTTLGSTRVETAFLSRFRLASGAGPTGAGKLTLTGPKDWNADQPFTRDYNGYTGFVWWNDYGPDPLIGTYTLSLTDKGETFTSSFEIDANDTLASPSAITVTGATATSIPISWPAVSGANAYLYQVWNDTDKVNAFNKYPYTATTSGTITGPALSTGKSYFAQVHSMNFNPEGGVAGTAFTGVFPKQFNVGFHSVAFTF